MRARIMAAIVGGTAIAALGLGAGLPAMASASTTACDAGHGAPGGFGPHSPYYTVAQSPNVTAPQYTGYQLGQAQGVNTGQANSGYSAYCNTP